MGRHTNSTLSPDQVSLRQSCLPPPVHQFNTSLPQRTDTDELRPHRFHPHLTLIFRSLPARPNRIISSRSRAHSTACLGLYAQLSCSFIKPAVSRTFGKALECNVQSLIGLEIIKYFRRVTANLTGRSLNYVRGGYMSNFDTAGIIFSTDKHTRRL
ncbi:hypothetical protein AcW1_006255 [Taiwanofungus camphoratus]|nr:hypothetical protein AcW1_006255 [Antrodia cinnamomea]